jgi:hypothetical protein
MSAQTSLPADTASDSAHALAQARIERQLGLLGEMAEIGLTIARAVERQATGTLAEDKAPVTTGDVTLAYERVARAVGMTVALQSRLVSSLQDLEKTGAETRDQADRKRLSDGRSRKIQVAHIVNRVAWSAYRRDHDKDAARTLLDKTRGHATDWLSDQSRTGDLMARPLSEIVADICRDPNLSPDWPGPAAEAWAREAMQGGEVGEPLAEFISDARPLPRSGGGEPRSGGGGKPSPSRFRRAVERVYTG